MRPSTRQANKSPQIQYPDQQSTSNQPKHAKTRCNPCTPPPKHLLRPSTTRRCSRCTPTPLPPITPSCLSAPETVHASQPSSSPHHDHTEPPVSAGPLIRINKEIMWGRHNARSRTVKQPLKAQPVLCAIRRACQTHRCCSATTPPAQAAQELPDHSLPTTLSLYAGT
jgi:hypothetical protein